MGGYAHLWDKQECACRNTNISSSCLAETQQSASHFTVPTVRCLYAPTQRRAAPYSRTTGGPAGQRFRSHPRAAQSACAPAPIRAKKAASGTVAVVFIEGTRVPVPEKRSFQGRALGAFAASAPSPGRMTSTVESATVCGCNYKSRWWDVLKFPTSMRGPRGQLRARAG